MSTIPKPLSPGDAAVVKAIFARQARGAVAEAIRETDRLKADWMLSDILAARYLNTAYKPGREELDAWLGRFGDRPEAGKVRDLLKPHPPAAQQEASRRPRAMPREASPVAERVHELFVRNQDETAVAVATSLFGRSTSMNRAGGLFMGGLAAWRLRRLGIAGDFMAAAYDASALPSTRASAAFWMSRIEETRSNRAERALWLRRAAQETDSFYGQLARRTLGPLPPCLTGSGTIAEPDLGGLLLTGAGRRALGLLQVGEKQFAEAELRILWQDTWPDADYRRALVLVAQAAGLSQFASDVQSDRLADRQADRPYPSRQLYPGGGFIIDPSLIYALVHHESRFQSTVVSRTGARGLMQILPHTAAGIGALPVSQASRLDDPATNLAIGQRYLAVLAEDKSVAGDLVRVLASYAQGVVGMKRWVDTVNDGGDPLMFIEAIPDRSLTVFIQTVMSNSWVFAVTMHLPLTSLEELRAGAYPRLVGGARRQADSDRSSGSCPAIVALH